MLFGFLSDADREDFLGIATLLSLSDKPLLWDGKGQEEISARTNMGRLTIQKGEAESSLLDAWRSGVKSSDGVTAAAAVAQGIFVKGMTRFARQGVEKEFIERLKGVPLNSIQDEGVRWNVVSGVLRGLLQEKVPTTFYANKVMLFELMLLALADGRVTGIEYQFLSEFGRHHKLDDDDFNEILERAECMYREMQRTIALILE